MNQIVYVKLNRADPPRGDDTVAHIEVIQRHVYHRPLLFVHRGLDSRKCRNEFAQIAARFAHPIVRRFVSGSLLRVIRDHARRPLILELLSAINFIYVGWFANKKQGL